MPPVALQPPPQEARRRRKFPVIIAPPALPPAPGTAPLPPAILRTEEAARYLGLKSSTLEKARLVGKGPPYVQLTDRAVGYRVGDLNEYLERHRRQSTSEQQVGSRARGTNKNAARNKGRKEAINHGP
jgi:predicted DNA-binding transcriptional regulator AlpA